MLRTALTLGLCLPLAAAEDATSPLAFGNWSLGLSVHTAVPAGQLSSDVNHQLGFGLGFHVPVRLGDHHSIRPSFEWTGYRVNDRNWASRALASMIEADYSEDRLILRSYKVGIDYLVYSKDGLSGTYGVLSGGIQRSRLYLEERNVQQDSNSEQTSPIHSWDGLNTGWFGAGIGYQGKNHLFVEFKYTNWRYLAQPGRTLLETEPDARLSQREAHSFTLALGLRL